MGVTDRFVGALLGTRSRALSSVVVAGAVVIGLTAAIGAVAVPPTVAIYLEKADDVGLFAFADFGTPLRPLRRLLPDSRSKDANKPAGLDGGAAGLYGGSLKESVCEPDALVRFLGENPDRAAAWAGVLGITPADIASYVATLTPAMLRVDVRVTNHGYSFGRATPRQSILQAGTAVLVDGRGVPRVRCYCGNPLLPPRPVDGKVDLVGERWADFDDTKVYEIEPGNLDGALVLLNVEDGTLFRRPLGTRGEADTVLGQRDERVTVPPVVGRLRDDASALLRAAGFGVVEQPQPNPAPVGTVIGSSPESGKEAPRGATVTLVLSSGPGAGTTVTVPDVAGLDQAGAVAALGRVALAATVTSDESTLLPAGTVARTDPPAGTPVPAGTSVTVVVAVAPNAPSPTRPPEVPDPPTSTAEVDDDTTSTSSSSSTSTSTSTSTTRPGPVVPELRNRTLAEATALVERLGLVLRVQTVTRGGSTPGAVVGQVPVPGTSVQRGSTVVVAVFELPRVPDLLGTAHATAAARLRADGFEPRVVTRASTEPAGTVLAQVPSPGTAAAAGSVVELVESDGGLTVVPDVTGKLAVEAEKLLVAAGLVVELRAIPLPTPTAAAPLGPGLAGAIIPTDPRVGRVASQRPEAGATVARGSTVVLEIWKESPTAEVPDVVGLTGSAAQAVLTDAGFTVRTEVRVVPLEGPPLEAPSVLEQNPVAGTASAPGSVVIIVLADHRFVVPELVGKDWAAVARAVADTLTLVRREQPREVDSGIEDGTVLAQSVEPGEVVEFGTEVVVDVAVVPIRVPSVVGLDARSADERLRGAGFDPVRVEQPMDETMVAKAGTVVDQSITGMARRGTPVRYLLGFVEVRNVVGQNAQRAAGLLREMGYDVTIAKECDAEGNPGEVTKQEPTAGSRAFGPQLELTPVCERFVEAAAPTSTVTSTATSTPTQRGGPDGGTDGLPGGQGSANGGDGGTTTSGSAVVGRRVALPVGFLAAALVSLMVAGVAVPRRRVPAGVEGLAPGA